MNNIEKTFNKLRKRNELAFIAYLTAGDFGLETTYNTIKTLSEAGTDLIEIGIPYSEPVADGPVIEKASERALKNGTTIDDIFEMVSKVKKEVNTPLLVMTYYNCIFKYGDRKFIDKCRETGVEGIIVPDLPHEESDELMRIASEAGLSYIVFVTPTSKDRIRKITANANGFIYCVSTTGVTGTRAKLPVHIAEFLSGIKEMTDIPRAVGFGISTPEQIRELSENCEAVIVGSAIVKLIEQYGDDGKLVQEKVMELVKSLKKACIRNL